MSNILEGTRYQVEVKRMWLGQAEEALAIVEGLPGEITNLEGYADISGGAPRIYFAGDGEEVLEILSRHGATFEKRNLSIYSGRFQCRGLLEGVILDVSNLGTPIGCKVVPEEYTATRYKSICDNDEPAPEARDD